MRSEYFFSFIVSFTVGVGIESVLNFGYPLAILFATLSFFVLLSSTVGRHSKSVFLVSLVLLGCALGIFRVDVSQTNTGAYVLNNLVGKVTQVEGIIIDEPDVREAYTNIVLETNVLNAKSHILLRVPPYPEFRYGDEVSVFGKITIPKNFQPKEGVRAFDYKSYLAKDGIYYQMYFPKVSLVAHSRGNIIFEKLFVIKRWLMKNISENIPEPESSLAGGITLGTKQSLGDNLLQKFRETGVAHIVVLSGYNIAVVAGVVSRLVVFLPFSLRTIASALGIILFAMMVGGGATVVRATIMGLIIILARVLGRENDALRALVLAGGLMILVNPMILLHDVSFQLSFSATLALVTLVPVLEKYFEFISNRTLREIVVTTFATQIFVLPLILYHMGSVSLVGLIANIFILPVVPVAMLAVSFVALFAFVPLAGNLFALISYLILSYIIFAVDFFAQVPFAFLKNISFSLVVLFLGYALLAIFIKTNFPLHEQPQDY